MKLHVRRVGNLCLAVLMALFISTPVMAAEPEAPAPPPETENNMERDSKVPAGQGFSPYLSGPATVDTSLTDEEVVNALISDNANISNITITGGSMQRGVFSGAQDILGFDEGVILSTGDAKGAFRETSGSSNGGNINSDSDLESLNGGLSTRDVIAIEFDIIPESSTLYFQYIFASTEWDQAISVNDVFGLFIDGENRALLPSDNPVTVQDIINDSGLTSPVDPEETPSQGYFVNTYDLFKTNAFDFNGMSILLTCTANVTPGVSTHIKLALADTGDSAFNSGLFLRANGIGSLPPVSPTVTDPKGATYVIGDTAAAMNISASTSDEGTLSYQWYTNATNSNTGGTKIDGATGTSYIPPTDTIGTTYYYVEVTNSKLGLTETLTTNAAAIVVTDIPPVAPIVIDHPLGATYIVGDNPQEMQVSANAPDGGTLTYQWYRNTKNHNDGGTAIANATGASYMPPTDEAGTFYYYVVITNSLNGMTQTLTTNVATVIVKDTVISTDVPAKTHQSTGNSPQTGDLNQTAGLLALAVLSLSGMFIAFIKLKFKRGRL